MMSPGNHIFQDYLNHVYGDFTAIRRLHAGDAFGEIALITSSIRTASIICHEDCEVMTLTKESFDKILGIYVYKKYKVTNICC